MKRVVTQDPWNVGRTIEQRLEDIRRDGMEGRPPKLRNYALRSLGVYTSKESAENVVIFGCYPPFSGPRELQSLVKLLDRLEVDYTYLEKEYCCSQPLLEAEGVDREQVLSEARDFIGMNIAAARKRGAKRIIYNCIWCVHIAKMLFPNEDIEQVYRLDFLVDKLRDKKLAVKPTTIGYFEGCLQRTLDYTPVKLNWPAYRERVGAVSGLTVVDIPKRCCVRSPNAVAEEVKKRNVHVVVSPCNGCVVRMRSLVTMKSPQDIWLEALES